MRASAGDLATKEEDQAQPERATASIKDPQSRLGGSVEKERSSLDRRLTAKKFKIKNALTRKNYETIAGLQLQVHLIKEMQKAKQ